MLSGFFFYLFQPCKVGYNRDLDALILTAHSSYLVIISKKYCPDPFLFLFLFFFLEIILLIFNLMYWFGKTCSLKNNCFVICFIKMSNCHKNTNFNCHILELLTWICEKKTGFNFYLSLPSQCSIGREEFKSLLSTVFQMN